MWNSEIDKTFHLSQTFMRLTGVWPESEENFFSNLKFLISSFTLVAFLLIPQATKLFYVRSNLNGIIEVLSQALLVMFIAFCKLCNQWFKKKGKRIF